MYCLAQPSVFSHIVLNNILNTSPPLINNIQRLMCAVVVVASCLLSPDKKISERLHDVDVMVYFNLDSSVVMH